MPISPIQVPGRPNVAPEKEESTADKILKGLQIANQVFQIPVAYAQFTKNMAEKGVEEAKLAKVERQAGTSGQLPIFTKGETAEQKLTEFPAQKEGPVDVPLAGAGEDKSVLLGPLGREESSALLPLPAPEGIGAFKGEVYEEGKLTPKWLASDEKVKEHRTNVEQLSDKVRIESEIVKNGELYHKQFTDAANKALSSNAESIKAVQAWQRLNSPTIARLQGGEAAPDNYSDMAEKWLNRLSSDKSTVLTQSELKSMKSSADDSINNIRGQYQENVQQYRMAADELKVPYERVGIKDDLKLPEEKPRTSSPKEPKLEKPDDIPEEVWKKATPATRKQIIKMRGGNG